MEPSAVAQPRDPSHLEARHQILLDIARAINSHRDLQSLLRTIRYRLQELIRFDALSLILIDTVRQRTRLHYIDTDAVHYAKLGSERPLSESPILWALDHRQPFYSPQIEQEQRFPDIMEILRLSGVQSFATIALEGPRGIIGGLGFSSLQPDAYSPQDLAFLGEVANQVAVAVDGALLYEALRQKSDRLKLLLDTTNVMVQQRTPRALFQAISAEMRRVLEVDYVGITKPVADSAHLELVAGDVGEFSAAPQQGLLIPLDDTPSGLAFVSKKTQTFTEAELASMNSDVARTLIQEGFRYVCTLPLLSRAEALGTITLARRLDAPFSDGDLAMAEALTQQVSLAIESAVAYERIEQLSAKLEQEKLYLEDEIRGSLHFEEIIGESRALHRILRAIPTVAPTDSTVLIHGETGTGKELIARAIHRSSRRAQTTFVKLNCAAIPSGLIESELFGHERGAFTGALTQRIGRFELANGGTLFLDEIGELPLDLQPKLLRVLQEGEFERLGSSRTLRTNVRLIAATNRDLQEEIQLGRFRADLFYRLNVFPLLMPPLRERPEDIPLLVRYFVQDYAGRLGRSITTIPAEAMEALQRYSWPGNIRELQNLIERSVILSQGSVLRVSIEELAQPGTLTTRPSRSLDQVERDAIVEALEASHWKVAGPGGAAAKLGMKRTSLQYRMQKLGIKVERGAAR